LRRTTVGLIVLLAAQNAFGIFLTLYVSVNDPSQYAGVVPAMFASAAGALHAIGAALILVNTITLVVLAWPSRDPMLRALTGLTVVLSVLTSYLGYHFVVTQDNAYSFGMEMGFLALVLTAVGLLMATAASRGPGPEDGILPPASPRAPTA
jgi:hypothetical protein